MTQSRHYFVADCLARVTDKKMEKKRTGYRWTESGGGGFGKDTDLRRDGGTTKIMTTHQKQELIS